MRARRRGGAVELVTAAAIGSSTRETAVAALGAARSARTDHVLRVDRRRPPGYLRVAGVGPVLTWRAVCLHAMPTLSNWALEMGDIELM